MSQAELEALVRRVRACRLCREHPKGTPLPHPPRPILRARTSARIAICSQAPGTRAHKSGTPFTDPSGDRLRDWMGVTMDQFYDQRRIAIIPMGFCFPGLDAKGGDLPPRKECAPTWRSEVLAHLPKLELILLVGQYAQKWHLGKAAKGSLGATVAAWREYLPRYLPMPHPSWRNNAWLKRHPWFEAEVLPELKKRVAALL